MTLPEIDAFDRCITDVFLPTGNIVVNDGSSSAGVPNYQEFWYAMVGFASQGQGFDGNGTYLRTASGGGNVTIATGKISRQGQTPSPLFGQALF